MFQKLFCLSCSVLGCVLIADLSQHPLLSSPLSGPLERRDSDIVRPCRQMALAPGREQVEPTLSILAVTSARTNNKCFHQPAPPCSCLSSSGSSSPTASCPARPTGSPTREFRSFVSPLDRCWTRSDPQYVARASQAVGCRPRLSGFGEEKGATHE